MGFLEFFTNLDENQQRFILVAYMNEVFHSLKCKRCFHLMRSSLSSVHFFHETCSLPPNTKFSKHFKSYNHYRASGPPRSSLELTSSSSISNSNNNSSKKKKSSNNNNNNSVDNTTASQQQDPLLFVSPSIASFEHYTIQNKPSLDASQESWMIYQIPNEWGDSVVRFSTRNGSGIPHTILVPSEESSATSLYEFVKPLLLNDEFADLLADPSGKNVNSSPWLKEDLPVDKGCRICANWIEVTIKNTYSYPEPMKKTQILISKKSSLSFLLHLLAGEVKFHFKNGFRMPKNEEISMKFQGKRLESLDPQSTLEHIGLQDGSVIILLQASATLTDTINPVDMFYGFRFSENRTDNNNNNNNNNNNPKTENTENDDVVLKGNVSPLEEFSWLNGVEALALTVELIARRQIRLAWRDDCVARRHGNLLLEELEHEEEKKQKQLNKKKKNNKKSKSGQQESLAPVPDTTVTTSQSIEQKKDDIIVTQQEERNKKKEEEEEEEDDDDDDDDEDYANLAALGRKPVVTSSSVAKTKASKVTNVKVEAPKDRKNSSTLPVPLAKDAQKAILPKNAPKTLSTSTKNTPKASIPFPRPTPSQATTKDAPLPFPKEARTPVTLPPLRQPSTTSLSEMNFLQSSMTTSTHKSTTFLPPPPPQPQSTMSLLPEPRLPPSLNDIDELASSISNLMMFEPRSSANNPPLHISSSSSDFLLSPDLLVHTGNDKGDTKIPVNLPEIAPPPGFFNQQQQQQPTLQSSLSPASQQQARHYQNPSVQMTASFINCVSCGNLVMNARFCSMCGSPLTQTLTSMSTNNDGMTSSLPFFSSFR